MLRTRTTQFSFYIFVFNSTRLTSVPIPDKYRRLSIWINYNLSALQPLDALQALDSLQTLQIKRLARLSDQILVAWHREIILNILVRRTGAYLAHHSAIHRLNSIQTAAVYNIKQTLSWLVSNSIKDIRYRSRVVITGCCVEAWIWRGCFLFKLAILSFW